MKSGYKKYIPFEPIAHKKRKWPDKVIKKAPIWCSVDLRDGNQALVTPMKLSQKLLFFKTLTDIGIKQIEIGFPSASDTEFEITRTLIEESLIPDDVIIQVLVQAREHLIDRTFEAIEGAKNIIFHFYNSTSTLQRKVVFDMDMDGVIDIAVNAAKHIRKKSQQMMERTGANITYEYSPESFSGTEMDNAVRICDEVLEALGATPSNKAIINLPNTVEMSTPNTYADQVEYFIQNLKNRDSAIISVHPHNDRGTATAATELAIMAGAERVEGTLFGNGERTGNCDLINLAANLYSQGIDPEIDISAMNHLMDIYEECTQMRIHERHPYAGELVFTAFSGSHQDAINKGMEYMRTHSGDNWEIPYLPIDPADIGRKYEPIIRINSQSGKGGAAFVMSQSFGFILPKEMHPEFGACIKSACDAAARELSPDEIFEIFTKDYVEVNQPYNLQKYKIYEENDDEDNIIVDFEGVIRYRHESKPISGKGNGPIDAFFNALKGVGIKSYEFVSYSEHAVSTGADSRAVSYITLNHEGSLVFGVGIDNNITIASIKGIICAINRAERKIRNENR